MAFNYTNLDMIPLYGASMTAPTAATNVTNLLGNHTTHQGPPHHHFVLSNAQVTQPSSVVAQVSLSAAAAKKRERTPSPPPAPQLSDCQTAKCATAANQGTAPMDLEMDSDNELEDAETDSPRGGGSSGQQATAAAMNSLADGSKTATQQQQQQALPQQTATATATANLTGMHDPNLYLNGLLGGGGMQPTTTPYMFFQAAAAAVAAGAASANGVAAASAAAAGAGPVATAGATAQTTMMEHTAMMAAIQQHQQKMVQGGFPGAYGASDGADTFQGLTATATGAAAAGTAASQLKQVIQTPNCILYPPHPNAPPPTIRERPPGCRTVFVGGLPENITDDVIREIFESCGEITTLRMSKKNFCHIRFRHEASIDRAIYLSGYRVRVAVGNEPHSFGRFHVDYALARDDQYDYECRQRQLQREQRHRERMSLERMRSQSPPAMPHYTDHEASLVADNLRNNETFVKAVQTIAVWLERGDCTKRNAYIFYSMIQSTNAHVKRLHGEKQQLEDELRKSRENYRKQMLTMAAQFTQIEKVFNAASHKKVWDHFTKAQRKNIDQWKKMTSVLRAVHIEDDEMEMSDEDRDYQSSSAGGGSGLGHAKRMRMDSEGIKEENDSLRCQLEAIRNEMSLDRSDLKYNSDFREKQIKVLQETIRNTQTQLLQTKMREQKDAKLIEQLERKLKEAGVKQLLLNTKIKDISRRLKERPPPPPSEQEHVLRVVAGDIERIAATVMGETTANGDGAEDGDDVRLVVPDEDDDDGEKGVTSGGVERMVAPPRGGDNLQIIDIDFCKSDEEDGQDGKEEEDDEVKIVEAQEAGDKDDQEEEDVKIVGEEEKAKKDKGERETTGMGEQAKKGEGEQAMKDVGEQAKKGEGEQAKKGEGEQAKSLEWKKEAVGSPQKANDGMKEELRFGENEKEEAKEHAKATSHDEDENKDQAKATLLHKEDKTEELRISTSVKKDSPAGPTGLPQAEPSRTKDESVPKRKDTISVPEKTEEQDGAEVASQTDTAQPKAVTLTRFAAVEARIIALATAYLIIHPDGVSTWRIHYYLNDLCRSHNITVPLLEDTLSKYPNLFRTEARTKPDAGGTMIAWKFCGFDEFAN